VSLIVIPIFLAFYILHSSIVTDSHLNVLKVDGTPDPDIWAIGDASMMDGVMLPATAQGGCFIDDN
jgi:hypothetical protein